MLRFLIASPLIVLALLFGALYWAYGQVDPCRVLAVERARRAAQTVGQPLGNALEPWTRLETSQLSTGECTSDLLDSWGARLSRRMP